MQLDRHQAERIQRVINPTVGYLYRLRTRLEQNGRPPSDPLYQFVRAAFDSLQSLSIDLHYRAVDDAADRTRPE
ncbi:MAG TPA: hypothetical protein VH120_01450 [Gemmataceae bacterium]|nr:hypothetical protein [Gemmataceae bacterium]